MNAMEFDLRIINYLIAVMLMRSPPKGRHLGSSQGKLPYVVRAYVRSHVPVVKLQTYIFNDAIWKTEQSYTSVVVAHRTCVRVPQRCALTACFLISLTCEVSWATRRRGPGKSGLLA